MFLGWINGTFEMYIVLYCFVKTSGANVHLSLNLERISSRSKFAVNVAEINIIIMK